MQWNKSEYGDVGDIRIPPSRLWKPDVLMYNRYVPKTTNGSKEPSQMKLRKLSRTGVLLGRSALVIALPSSFQNISIWFYLLQRRRSLRWNVPGERGGLQHRCLHLHPSRDLQINLQDRHHVVPFRRPRLQHEVWQLDIQWLQGKETKEISLITTWTENNDCTWFGKICFLLLLRLFCLALPGFCSSTFCKHYFRAKIPRVVTFKCRLLCFSLQSKAKNNLQK